MSVKAMEWAWTVDVSNKTESLVLLALAHSHNGKTGQCNPKIDKIVEMTGCPKRSVQRALKELERRGYIHKAKRRKGPRQASNQYILALDGVVFQGGRSGTLKGDDKCSKWHPESAQNGTLYSEQEIEQECARSSKVVKVEFGEGNSGRIDKTTSVSQVDISRSAEKGENRNRSG